MLSSVAMPSPLSPVSSTCSLIPASARSFHACWNEHAFPAPGLPSALEQRSQGDKSSGQNPRGNRAGGELLKYLLCLPGSYWLQSGPSLLPAQSNPALSPPCSSHWTGTGMCCLPWLGSWVARRLLESPLYSHPWNSAALFRNGFPMRNGCHQFILQLEILRDREVIMGKLQSMLRQ
ncbi:uncharacterized protein LOC143434134 [Arvicanthis niloticus]|uniref:uncharacterized protein LOC143308532 n=1 Tax=Arvicanthis niloticus TaxID=61156 RepID=UPI00402BE409